MKRIAEIGLLCVLLGLGSCKLKPKPHNRYAPTIVEESYTTKTADNYTIALHRFYSSDGIKYREPIFMSAGFLEDGDVFDLEHSKGSLVRSLAKKGFDCWTYDIRGTGESTIPPIKYTSAKIDFSDPLKLLSGNGLEELATWKDVTISHFVMYDTPAALNFVLAKTGAPQVQWIAHSSGAMMMFGYCQLYGESKVKACISMGGIGITKNLQIFRNKFANMVGQVGILLVNLVPDGLPIPLKWSLDQMFEKNVTMWAGVAYAFDTKYTDLLWNHENVSADHIYQIMKRVLGNTSTSVLKEFNSMITKGEVVLGGIQPPAKAPPKEGTKDTKGTSAPAASTLMSALPNMNMNALSSMASSPAALLEALKAILAKIPALTAGGKMGQGYNLSANLNKITRPILFLAGGGDNMASVDNIKESCDRVSSTDKKLIECSKKTGHTVDYGHMDMMGSYYAWKEVYPHVDEWLLKNASPR